MKIISRPSPNRDSRDNQAIDMLVLHYTGMRSATEALDRLCDPTAKVSAHYMVDEDGTVYNLVDESERAWHAGKSFWRGATNINQRSIGIEIVNPGHEFGYRPFPPAQMEAVARLSKDIVERHRIPSWNVVAHSDIAPERKSDPGELFDWAALAQEGVGKMPAVNQSLLAALIHTPMKWVARLFSSNDMQPEQVQRQLAQFGYPVTVTGQFDAPTRQVITAFQRHFHPGKVNGLWDDECAQALEGLLKYTPAVTMGSLDSRLQARVL